MNLTNHLMSFFLFFASCANAAHIAVLETIGDSKTLNFKEKQFLTDNLRQIAVDVLPSTRFVIMTRENITVMLPPGKAIEDCEGSCLVETGKNISADFIAQARVSHFGKSLTITVELYETASGKLVSSFNGQSRTANGLLQEIKDKAPTLFSKIKGAKSAFAENEGFSGFQSGASYSIEGSKQFIIKVNTQPLGAMVSVDGKPKCSKTPCNVQLNEGNHSFSFALDMYFDKDTVLRAFKNEQNLNVKLKPNFGMFEIVPQIDKYGKKAELSVIIDGEKKDVKKIKLAAKKHHVELSHQCYEPMSFDVTIKSGGELKFDRKMEPAMGGLSLTAEGENGPISMPVFIDGKQLGSTPFYESVPICARIEIGQEKDSVPVKLKYHEKINYVYKGFSYKTVKIGNQIWMAENLNKKTKESWCFNNKSEYCKKYGRLYTWNAAQKACPFGWHLPTKQEFETLLMTIGGQSFAGNRLKTKTGWEDDGNGNDTFGFSVLPAGGRNIKGDFAALGWDALFWSATESMDDYAYNISFANSSEICSLDENKKNFGFSVRCIKNELKTGEEKDISLKNYSDDIKDKDGNVYKTVKIGKQIWMAENLKVEVENSSCYDNNPKNCKKYGRLYSWDAAKHACPSGWHLPNENEFKTLLNTVGGFSQAGNKLKSSYVWHKNFAGYDDYGFAALPAGDARIACASIYCREGKEAHFWSSSKQGGSGYIYNLTLTYEDYARGAYDDIPSFAKLSVRCIKDAETKKVSLKDSRDNQVYPTVKIGEQIWMAQNLNVKTQNSWCYEDKFQNCDKYGRLYTWKQALHICPAGWHLPSEQEFETLKTSAGGKPIVGFNHSSLPIGHRRGYDGRYFDDGASFWSSEESQNTGIYAEIDGDGSIWLDNGGETDYGRSVRCIKNKERK